jgi:hypothetical protein
MHPQINAIFDEAEKRYLKPDELDVLNHYVNSLPERLETYRRLRDLEVDIMQPVADQLQSALPNEKQEDLERSLKNALLMLRYCAMAMLLNDDTFIQERLLSWLEKSAQVYKTYSIDSTLYRLLNQRLSQTLTPQQLNLLKPPLALAQSSLLKLLAASA